MDREITDLKGFEVQMADEAAIKKLASSKGKASLSIYLPVHSAPPQSEKNVVHLKNAIKEAKEQLALQNVDDQFAKACLEPLEALLDEPQLILTGSRGVALFIGEDIRLLLRLPFKPEFGVRCARRFDLKQLLYLLGGIQSFYLLAIARKNCRFYLASHGDMERVTIEEMPEKMSDVTWADDPEKSLQMHSGASLPRQGATGSVPEGITHGHGTPKDLESEQIERFIAEVARAVSRHCASDGLPLVLVGDEKNIGLFIKHASSGDRDIRTIQKNSDSMQDDKLLELANEQLRDSREEHIKKHIENYFAAENNLRLAQLREIVTAASIGRIETCILAVGQSVYGVLDAKTGETKILNQFEKKNPDCHDLVDLAAQETLNNGGNVISCSTSQMPENFSSLAIARY